MTKTVKFLRDTYVVEGTVGAPDGAIFLDTLPAAKLVELCNLIICHLDLGRNIKMFQSKAKGVKRVVALLIKYDAAFPDDDLPDDMQPDEDQIEAKAYAKFPSDTNPQPTPPEPAVKPASKKKSSTVISVEDLLAHDFEEEDLEIVKKEWPAGIPATEASVKRAFDLGMDGGVFRVAIAAVTVPTGKVRDGSKQAALIALIKRPEGASIQDICAALNWVNHTARGAISRDLKKRLGLPVTKSRVDGRGQVYRITE